MGTAEERRIESDIINSRLGALERKQMNMADDVMELKSSLDSNTNALQEFIELGKTFKFTIKLLGVIESTAVWITKVSLAATALWAVWKFAIVEAVKQANKS